MARNTSFDEVQVLDKAVRLFWEKGYCDTSAQDIVDRLELNRSSIYNTFKDKRTLFIKALQRYRQNESAGLMAFLASQEPNLASVELLLEFVTAASLQSNECKGCLMVNSAAEMGARDPEVKTLIVENIQEVLDCFEDFFRRGQAAGAFPAAKDPHALAIALFHNLTALRITTKVMDDPDFFKKHINTILPIFQ